MQAPGCCGRYHPAARQGYLHGHDSGCHRCGGVALAQYYNQETTPSHELEPASLSREPPRVRQRAGVWKGGQFRCGEPGRHHGPAAGLPSSIGSIKPVIGATAGYATRFCAADIGRRQAEMLRRQAEMLRRMSGRVIREQVRRRFGQPGGYFPAATAQRRSAGSPQPASLRVSSEFMPAPHRLPARTA